jgi:3-oxoadipate enol-lactonase
MPEPQMPTPGAPIVTRRRFVQGDTHEISLAIAGDGPPLLMLHPLALAGRVWDRLAERLAEYFQVIAMDARGHGESSWNGEQFTIEDLADDVTLVLDSLSLRSAHLLGMSMGGSIALTFAGLNPERVDHLVLADTTAWYGEDAVATWEGRAEKALNVRRTEQVPFQTERWFTEDFRQSSPDEVRRVVDIFVETDSAVHAAASRAMGRMDSREVLSTLTAPTLVMTGEQDYATPPAMGQYIAEHVKDGHALTLRGLRHLSLVERPDLADLVSTHLEDTA